MTTEPFDEFLATTGAYAAAAYVCGDATPITLISTLHDPATFFGPAGGSVTGAESVIETNQTGAAMFEPGGETRLEVMHAGHDGNLAYWVGFQHATVHMAGRDEPVPMKLRITELFRYEDDAWKLYTPPRRPTRRDRPGFFTPSIRSTCRRHRSCIPNRRRYGDIILDKEFNRSTS